MTPAIRAGRAVLWFTRPSSSAPASAACRWSCHRATFCIGRKQWRIEVRRVHALGQPWMRGQAISHAGRHFRQRTQISPLLCKRMAKIKSAFRSPAFRDDSGHPEDIVTGSPPGLALPAEDTADSSREMEGKRRPGVPLSSPDARQWLALAWWSFSVGDGSTGRIRSESSVGASSSGWFARAEGGSCFYSRGGPLGAEGDGCSLSTEPVRLNLAPETEWILQEWAA
jgi:hypothetical protein